MIDVEKLTRTKNVVVFSEDRENRQHLRTIMDITLLAGIERRSLPSSRTITTPPATMLSPWFISATTRVREQQRILWQEEKNSQKKMTNGRNHIVACTGQDLHIKYPHTLPSKKEISAAPYPRSHRHAFDYSYRAACAISGLTRHCLDICRRPDRQ